MNWTEAEIYTSTEGIDILCASLLDIGIKGFAIKDSEDFNEFLENKDGKWDYIDDDLMGLKNCETSVTVYLPDNSQGAEMLISLKQLLKRMKERDSSGSWGRLEFEIKSVKEEDWANNWKQYFKPLKVGEKLLVKPSWEEYDGSDSRTILEIDPASSFGTGQHNTTKLCLELLEKAVKGGERILDLGCGSGILSIGGILLGAKEATAVDIEENAVATALENAVKNNISMEKYHAYCGDIISDTDLREKIGSGYDIITANIVADVLIAMSTLFRSFLKPKSILIISGIITERKFEVVDAVVEAGFEVIEEAEGDGWAAVMLKIK
ncbi:MAG: 50S ribosomal protein L11 methyltransferase [Porcipelethomonas sp.]